MSARQTSYKKADDTGNDTIELEGSVVLSVTKNNTTTEIRADRVSYDRKTEMLYAEGNVEIDTKGTSSGGEKTTANSLLMNTSTLEGIFDGGRVVQTKSDALNLPSGSTLIVFADIFGKSSNNVIAFKNSSLTFCDEENPHWHIDATRTWLLPGGEFAFFNALLYVGVVPVLYFPAFYYPKDELIFNPVFSYKEREGTSIQTTTYLWGRKPLESGNNNSSTSNSDSSASADSLKAVYNFVKPSALKEQKLEGIVLHNLDEDYKGDTSQYLKLMADWYSNLGWFAGLDGNFIPKNQYVSKFAFNVNLGFSNTIFRNGSDYRPYAPGGLEFDDTSNFMGTFIPFRYSGKLDFVLAKPFSFSLNVPIYSDPYFSGDFLTNRSETMDWISYFLDSTKENKSISYNTGEISSFSWQMSSSYSPSLPAIINPYISSLSFRANSSVNFSSKNVEKKGSSETLFYTDRKGNKLEETSSNTSDYNLWRKNTPNRKFYYPSSVIPAAVDLSLSGTLFSWPMTAKTQKNESTKDYGIALNIPEELKAPEEEKKEQAAEEKEEEKEEVLNLTIPELEFTPEKITLNEKITYKLSYSINSNLNTQLSYSPNNLYTAEDFDWNNVRSFMYTWKIPLSLASNFNYGGNFFTLSNSLSFSPVFQEHPYISDDVATGGYETSEIQKLIVADYNAENRDLLNNNTVTIHPFTYVKMFSDSNITWNSTYKLYRRKFVGTADNEQWESVPFDWNDDTCVTVNSLSATISAKQLNSFKQNLTFSSVLPPLLRQYTATLGLTFPYVTASISTGYREVTKDKVPDSEKWKKSPLNQSLNVSLLNSKINFSESYVYNLEDEHNESLRLSASLYGLSIAYSMAYTTGYDFDSSGYTARAEKEFLPYSFNLSYNFQPKTYYKWFNRISFAPGVNMNFTADLIRPTNTNFVISPSLNFKINDFLDISFSATSRNSILYWYFHDGLYDEGGPFPGNMFTDLVNSFRFDDTTKREGSGFKLNSLNLKISHELHDWKFDMAVKLEPRLLRENGRAYYDFNPYVSIGVVWKPMESMKTSIIDDYGEWKLE